MRKERILHGIAASPGIGIGRAITAVDFNLVTYQVHLRPESVKREVARFRDAVGRCREQLNRVRAELEAVLGRESASVIDAHLLMLEDRMLIDRIVDRIEVRHINAEWAIQQVSDEIFKAYDSIRDDYLRERRGDLEDIVRRLLHNLSGRERPIPGAPSPGGVLAGKIVPPSMLIELRAANLAGLASEIGSSLSHTAILARSLGIPAVTGVAGLSHELAPGEMLIIDGDRGEVVCSPTDLTLKQCRLRTRQRRRGKSASRPSSAPSVTKDGVAVTLGININFAEEIHAAVQQNCALIGLYRTEFDFFRGRRQPGEDELAADYITVVRAAKSATVTFRTIDVGIDQESWDGDVSPSFGVRGLRFCLERPELFRKQLRAIYRASAHGRARIVLPFVSTVQELDAALEIIRDVRGTLGRQGIPYDRSAAVGVMIETPAAAQTCDLMASRADFLCLGTNDLIQYYLVVDRADRSVTHLYSPFHPAILRCLKQIRESTALTRKEIVVCGEMAADPASAIVLLGLGFTALSVNIGAYARIQSLVRAVSLRELRELSDELLRLQDPARILQSVRSAMAGKVEVS